MTIHAFGYTFINTANMVICMSLKKKKAYQCTSISLQRHAVKVSNLLDGFKRLLVQHSFRKRNVSHQFHLHTRFFNHRESRF